MPLLCFVYVNVKAFIEVHLLFNISYMHLQVHPTLRRLSQPEPACCLQQTGTVFVLNTAEDTQDCLVACGNISPWLSHTVIRTAYMSSHLSALLQWASVWCVCLCVFFTSVMNRCVVSHMQLLTSSYMKASAVCLRPSLHIGGQHVFLYKMSTACRWTHQCGGCTSPTCPRLPNCSSRESIGWQPGLQGQGYS